MASIPGMGIPEQLKAAMEQEQSSESLLELPMKISECQLLIRVETFEIVHDGEQR